MFEINDEKILSISLKIKDNLKKFKIPNLASLIVKFDKL